MIRFLVRRALRGLLVIWLITLVLFGMFFVAPSNVAQTLGGRQATPGDDRADQPAARAGPAASGSST